MKRKLSWKTFTCGAVFEITPKIISCPNVAIKTGDAICKPIYNTFDVILCDEAHRLNKKSGMFKNKGENQIKEIIHASKVSVFLIDEKC